jgi:UrcA family protein
MKHENWWVMFAAASTAVVIIGGAATAALAQHQTTTTVVGERPSEYTRTVRVSYADLNLAAVPDQRILNRRVGGAARDVCGPNDAASLSDHGFADCVSGAWSGARPQIAMAIQRASEIAQTGTSSIPMVAIAIVAR